MASNFPEMLAQMVGQARPQVVPGQGIQQLGPISRRTREGGLGGGLLATGRELEHLGDVMIQQKKTYEDRAQQFYEAVSKYQGPEKEFWESIKPDMKVQLEIQKLAKYRPELFTRDPRTNLWDVVPSSAAGQAYREKEADIGKTEAEGRKVGAEARIRGTEARVGESTEQTQIEKIRQDLLKAKAETTTEEQKGRLYGKQVEMTELEMRLAEAKGPLERTRIVAETQWLERQVAASMEKMNLEYEELIRKTRSEGVKQILQSTQPDFEAILKRQASFRGDPYQDASDAARIGNAAAKSFAESKMAVGTDPETGESLYANVPGVVQEPGGRYIIGKSLEMMYASFRKLWETGDEESLKQARELVDKAESLYNSTYGSIMDPRAFDVIGGGQDLATDVFRKLTEMKITIDQVYPIGDKNKMPGDSKYWRAATSYFKMEPLPPVSGSRARHPGSMNPVVVPRPLEIERRGQENE